MVISNLFSVRRVKNDGCKVQGSLKNDTLAHAEKLRLVKRVRRFKVEKKKVIRVESEETQDYMRESLNLSRDDADETSFVPSAISIPQKPMFWCDNRCSEKALSFWQFASVVVEEGEESYTANMCQLCYNKNLMAKGDAPLTKSQWYAVVEKKAYRGRLARMLVKDQFFKECGSTSLLKERKRKSS